MKLTIQLPDNDYELLKELARECLERPEQWAAETVQVAIAEKRAERKG